MRLLYSNLKEWYSDETVIVKWKVLKDLVATTSDDLVIYQGNILFLQGGIVYTHTLSGEKKPLLIESSLRFISLCAAYDKLFLVTEDGRLYGCGSTKHGECGVISAHSIESLQEIKFFTALSTCPHGCFIANTESLKVKFVQTSASEVCLVDFDGRLWRYGNGKLDYDSLGRIHVRPVQLAFKRKILQLSAGREHFVCLAIPALDLKDDTNNEKSSTLELKPSTNCKKCLEEYELRLSTLMNKADEENESQMSSMKSHEVVDVSTCVNTDACRSLGTDYNFSSGIKYDVTDVRKEMLFEETEMTELKNLRPNSTLVSLQNIHGTDYSSLPCTVRSYSSSVSNEEETRLYSENYSDLLPEVWTWGANEHGQLGHGDFVMRREPSKVTDLSNKYCIKISAGDEHTIVLIGSGELYVWGSNSAGQLKQLNLPHVAKPTFFKVGSHSFVLDAFARGYYTGVIVGGIADSAAFYLCGSKKLDSPKIIPLLKEVGYPVWACLENETAVLGVQQNNLETEKYMIQIFTFFQQAKFVHHLFQRTKILRDIVWRADISQIETTLKFFESKRFFQTLFQFHADFVDCIAYGCFAELDIWL
ncbi:unnamed protein product [Thelazia callipaeda]|uniref:Alsin n=1 Tax=Thelazia callipaeda TaxID=103827 RepID=A0A0N5D3I7_THECL|nr:unnamed protein product [Thelazia callipaeda]